jgi:S1-C subfamily serine protease
MPDEPEWIKPAGEHTPPPPAEGRQPPPGEPAYWQGGYGPPDGAPQPGYGGGYPWAPPVPPVPPRAARSGGSRWRRGVGAGVAAIAVAAGAFTVVAVQHHNPAGPAAAPASDQTVPQTRPRYRWGDQFPGGAGGSSGDGSVGGGSTTGATLATTAQQVGVVNVDTVLNYGSGKAAGTGIVLTAGGEILTNNHVVSGSTSITVTVVSTGKSYSARVVGTDPSDDIAVLQLSGASGLATAHLGNSGGVQVGDAVTAVGNAGGTGTPSAAAGKVTALDQSITATDENGDNPENLTGLIQTDANVKAGDSGGPLYDADNTVVGIDTAASADRRAATTGYAIPIATATRIAALIESGVDNTTIHQGYPAFLGVQLANDSTTATITGVVDGSAADRAGLAAGDRVTAVDGTRITTAAGLHNALAAHNPGDRVRVAWVDAAGSSHAATATLGTGPAD